MRVTFSQILILLLLTGISSAEPLSAQEVLNRKIDLFVKNKTFTEVIKELSTKHNIQFVYDQAIIDHRETISLNVSNESLKDILNQLQTTYNFSYEVFKDKVILVEKQTQQASKVLQSQVIMVTGKVSDENDQPLPGLSVKVKGGTAGTQTDIDGVYRINVDNSNAVLVFSFIGYNAQEVAVAGKTTLNIKMVPNRNSLDEVVVVGYGTQKKSDVTGAVTRANLDDFRNSPSTNVAQLLQGTVPGLNVGQVTSAGSTPSINIRGANTINGSKNVLIVLDGIQYNGSLESINPDDIESIDILKDASSVAVYGAQGANGVILITSRKGKQGQKPRFSFTTSYATQTPSGNLRPMGREEYIEHVRELYYDQAYLAPDYTEPNPAFNLASKFDNTMTDDEGNLVDTHFDWYDEATHTGYVQDNQLSISGASEKINYLISGAYTGQSGFIKNDEFKRKSLRVNLESQATDWLKLGVQSFGSFVNKDGAEPNISTIIQQSPLILPYDEEGNLKPFPFETNFSNPFLGYDVEDYERHNYLFANLYSVIDFPFVKGLSYRINFGNNYRINQQNGASEYEATLNGRAYKEFSDYYDYTLDNILSYSKTFAKHDLSATLLYGAIERKNSYTLAEATIFDRLSLGYNSLEQGGIQKTYSDAWRESLNYQMARVNYKFNGKYLFTGTIRRDGFSGFAENHKFAYFPSAALGWVISSEPFFKPVWVDYLKLRIGYGVTGNQTSRYSSLAGLSSGASYVFGDGGSTLFGQQLQSLANPNLRWERTRGLNIGTDFTLLKGRLSGAIEYYYNRTTDLLYDIQLPYLSGIAQIRSNIGDLQNTGYELSLNSKNIDGENFKWNSTLNFSRNTNKLISLLGEDANNDGIEDDLTASGLFIGKSIDMNFGYQPNGIYQVGETVPSGYYVGNFRVLDANGDGEITTDDRIFKGRGSPSFRISLLNTFSYKNFNLSIFLNSIQGGEIGYRGANSPSIIRDDNAVRYNYLSGIDYWSPNNPDGKYPRSINSGTLNPVLLQDRSFIRLQDISLSYNFKGDFIKRLKLQNLNLYVSGKNLATWTDWEGWDPETNQGLTINGRPVLKGYAFGLNVTF